MIRSMTGYGAAQRTEDGVRYSLELRSLNNRYFKTSIRLPEHLQFLETDVDKLLHSRISRGSVTLLLRVRDDSEAAASTVNAAALQSYLQQIRKAADVGRAGSDTTVDLAVLVGLPGVCQPPELDEVASARFWQIVEALTTKAMDAVLDMRRVEGDAIREDLLGHCESIREHLRTIGELAPRVVEEYRKRLGDRVNTLLNLSRLSLEEDALVREVALFADRCDISEEIARLTSHLDQFAGLCESPEPAGRKLDFLAQELLREANTIGSKSNDAAITRQVVDIKSLIDRLKEQVQNVE